MPLLRIISFLLFFAVVLSQDSTIVIHNDTPSFVIDTIDPNTTLISPDGQETYLSGELISIEFLASDDSFGEAPITLSIAEFIGGYFYILSDSLPNGTQTEIQLPTINTAFALIKIYAIDQFGNSTFDISDGYITIGTPPNYGSQDSTLLILDDSPSFNTDTVEPTLQLISPNGSESFEIGTNIPIEWSAQDDSFTDTSISIYLSQYAGSSFNPFIIEIPNTGFAFPIVPDINSNFNLIKVTATDFFGNSAIDISDGYFTTGITENENTFEDSTLVMFEDSDAFITDTKDPVVNLIAPVGGGQFDSGGDLNIEWFAEDDSFSETPIDMSIAVGIGEYFIPVENDVPNLPEYIVTLPEENHPFVRMRILAEDLFGNVSQDESQDYFILGDPFEDYVAGEFDDLVILNWGWGKYHLVAISSDALAFLDPGDEIYILDENGIIEEGCPENNDDSFGPIITGTITYDGSSDLPLPIICTGSIDYCDMNGPRLPGYIENNEIHFLIHDVDIDEIYEVFPTSFTIGSGIFGEPLTLVDSFESPQLIDRSELPDPNRLSNNRVDYSANIFRNDELIESLDDSDFYFDTDVLLGEQYCYMIEIVDELNAEILNSSMECLIIGEGILGCTDINANNFNPLATIDDGSCEYDNLGDITNDGMIDVIDIVYLVDLIFYPENQTEYHLFSGDLDGDGSLTVIDIVYLVDLILNS